MEEGNSTGKAGTTEAGVATTDVGTATTAKRVATASGVTSAAGNFEGQCATACKTSASTIQVASFTW